MNTIADFLWGKRASFIYLFIAAIFLLFTFLGAKDIWTQEHRWADIVSSMFFRHDFLHPYLNEVNYYDKPLLSYWLMAVITYFIGHASVWALRLPSAFAGLLAIWCIYRLGTVFKNKKVGLLAGWLLLTTFYFIFWARTSSADMLNMAGSLFAVYWYAEKKSQPTFFNYGIFFLILAVTSLCKGLVGAIVPLLVIFPDLLMKQEWKKHINKTFLLSMIPAVIIYILPFLASAYLGEDHYQQNGLYLVYRENILRYFHPFDHKDPIYTYFIFLPLYLLPWTIFFIPALFSSLFRWKTLSDYSKWMLWAVFLLFLFFTLSGSRRNYYILPVLPFSILIAADWIAERESFWQYKWTAKLSISFFIMLVINFIVFQPLYYRNGLYSFAKQVKEKASIKMPWTEWKYVMLDSESKIRFYLQLAPQVKNLSISGQQRVRQTEASLLNAWPILKEKNPNVVFISRKMYEPILKKLLPDYVLITTVRPFKNYFSVNSNDDPIAFIPLVSV